MNTPLPPVPCPPQGGGSFNESKYNEVIDAYVSIARESTEVKNDKRWRETVVETARNHPDIERWVYEYPNAAANQIAAWMHGDKHSMAYVASPPPMVVDDLVLSRDEVRALLRKLRTDERTNSDRLVPAVMQPADTDQK